MRIHVVVAAAILSLAATERSKAQSDSVGRPTVTVSAFAYGTVASQLDGDERARRSISRSGVTIAAFAEALGTGAADLIVEKLVASDRFRVFERKELAAIQREQQLDSSDGGQLSRARYLITGSISGLGMTDHEIGGFAAGMAMTMLFRRAAFVNVRSSSTFVHLTARVVDTRTGEIIGSFTGEGESEKRWGLTGFGMVPGGLGGGRVGDRNFGETAVGEATARAAQAIADQVVALRATRLRS